MKIGEKAKSENFEQVTLMHCDIPQYGDLALESTALQMVEMLNDMSDFYDAIIAQYDAYKVDSYKEITLIVSGLPKRNGMSHAQEICRVALILIYSIGKFKVKQREDMKLGLRIGIHTGPVMAGVVGENIPRYLLFGDTVNVSAQMLTGGEVMKAQLSLMTKICLDKTGSFELEERGEVFVKGKGAMKTYWLLGEFDNYQMDELRYKFEHSHIEEEEMASGDAASEEVVEDSGEPLLPAKVAV
ncbi:Atrial natriuretic peptide receptor 2 [Hypsibius exemplaris]|uniref:Atrial natriuretic peptide receptor 2 n=1 Tax=Hypsibius exemplaris TaxID=2072580 RepID=A0A1W0WPB3_HYPEX|nr:Atrial natriuretic peptide receptor 2 [Hypsibius exemplaris]